MKKIIAFSLAILMIFSLVACGGEDKYYDYDMEKYVKVGEFSTEVDKKSSEYIQYYDEYYSEIFGTKLQYKAKEGVVENGDIVNIDFAGYKDGVAFDGGTAEDYNLTIGSGQFIDGFEDGLIGAEIGSTVELNLTFPKDYGKEELNGAAVVFKVTINYALKYEEPSDENVTDFGFENLADYEEKAHKYATGISVFYNMFEATTINEYPEKEHDILLDRLVEYYENVLKENNSTLEDFAASNGMDVKGFKEYLSTKVISNYMKFDMLSHYILQKRNIDFGEKDIAASRAQLVLVFDENLEKHGYSYFEIHRKSVFDKAVFALSDEATVK